MSFDPPASDVPGSSTTAAAGGAAARVRLPVAPSPGLPRFSSPADIDDFVAGLSRYERGEMTPDEFRVFRLGRGTYGQRQMDVHMLRVKAPQGVITADQLELYARLSQDFSRGFGHVTTRQNIQLHFIPLARVPEALALLDTVGLTTKEACGNTVRNITGCAFAGVCSGAAFDTTPVARSTTRYFLRHPRYLALPRKFKIAFSGCEDDCAQGAINDVGLIARTRTVVTDGVTTVERGFRVALAGGLSTSPEDAHLLSDFVAEDELIPTIEAVLRVFDRCGNRQNKSRARLKYVVRKLGWEGFLKEFAVELEGVRAEGLGRVAIPPDDVEPVPSLTARHAGFTPRPGFAAWKLTNAFKQRQEGYFAAIARLVRGDITTRQFLDLARICRDFSDGTVRTTNDQNVVMRFVPEEDLPALHAALEDAGLGLAGARTISDVTACPGADSCNLAVTQSRELALDISARLEAGTQSGSAAAIEAGKSLDIKISGCPNSCGQHHVAALGFHGALKRVGGQAAPEYQLHLGGGIGPTGAVFGRQVVKIPARKVGDAVVRLLHLYEEDKRPGEKALDFFRRVDEVRVKAYVADLARLDEENVRPEDYVDLGQDAQFVVAIGAGECAT